MADILAVSRRQIRTYRVIDKISMATPTFLIMAKQLKLLSTIDIADYLYQHSGQ